VRHFRTAWLFILMWVLSYSGAKAQSTIFNVPTTDTAASGKVYVEFDFLTQLPGSGVSRANLYNPRLVVGSPGKLEFGVNVPIYRTSTSGVSTVNGYIQPNAKWKLFDHEKSGIAMAVGGLWNMPLDDRNAQDSWGLIYGVVSKKVKGGSYSPRFHAGPYGIVSANQDANEGPVSFTGPRAGVILGYEQPAYKSISVVADWFSGENGYGYFTPGISIALPRSGLVNAGYSIGNDSWENSNASRNRYFFVYYGITF